MLPAFKLYTNSQKLKSFTPPFDSTEVDQTAMLRSSAHETRRNDFLDDDCSLAKQQKSRENITPFLLVTELWGSTKFRRFNCKKIRYTSSILPFVRTDLSSEPQKIV